MLSRGITLAILFGQPTANLRLGSPFPAAFGTALFPPHERLCPPDRPTPQALEVHRLDPTISWPLIPTALSFMLVIGRLLRLGDSSPWVVLSRRVYLSFPLVTAQSSPIGRGRRVAPFYLAPQSGIFVHRSVACSDSSLHLLRRKSG